MIEFTASQIAALAGGTVDGDPDVTVSTIAKIEEAAPGAISFLANPKYTPYVYSTGASVVLVSRDFVPDAPVSATLVRVDDPYAAFTRLLSMAAKMLMPRHCGVEQPSFVAEGVEVDPDSYIGAFAYVGRGARLGRGVKIFPQVYIGEDVTIGDETVIYPGAKIYYGCHIGSRCIIHAGTVIGADGFGFAPNPDGSYTKIPQTGNVTIGDDVEIGANVTIDRATMGSTVIEAGVKIDNLVQIAHNCRIGQNTAMAAQSGVAGSAKLGQRCVVAGQVGFAGHITVGDDVMVGAQSGIPSDVQSGSKIMGYPAVDVRSFMRQAAQIKHLGDLFDRVKALERLAAQNQH